MWPPQQKMITQILRSTFMTTKLVTYTCITRSSSARIPCASNGCIPGKVRKQTTLLSEHSCRRLRFGTLTPKVASQRRSLGLFRRARKQRPRRKSLSQILRRRIRTRQRRSNLRILERTLRPWCACIWIRSKRSTWRRAQRTRLFAYGTWMTFSASKLSTSIRAKCSQSGGTARMITHFCLPALTGMFTCLMCAISPRM